MDTTSACRLIENLIYKPEWRFEPESFERRFEGTITVCIHYPAQKSEQDEAEKGYPTSMMTYAKFTMICAECDEISLYRQLLDIIMKVEAHEAREFLRVKPTYKAPFHPHTVDGMKAWGDVENDLKFGII